jgi:hypothetical protein
MQVGHLLTRSGLTRPEASSKICQAGRSVSLSWVIYYEVFCFYLYPVSLAFQQFVWEQTAICATYSINWLVFITEVKSVYSAVRTGPLNRAVSACATYSTNGLVFITEVKSVFCAVRTEPLNKAAWARATYSINWLVFTTEVKSVYSAVRSLNEAVCASSFKG